MIQRCIHSSCHGLCEITLVFPPTWFKFQLPWHIVQNANFIASCSNHDINHKVYIMINEVSSHIFKVCLRLVTMNLLFSGSTSSKVCSYVATLVSPMIFYKKWIIKRENMTNRVENAARK